MSKELTIEILKSRINIKEQNLDSIKSLNLYGLNLSELALLNKLPSLEILSLSNNQIKDISVLANHKNLKELYLSNNQINDINQLENLKNCQKLEKLILKGNPISNNPHYLEKINLILPNLIFLDEKGIKAEKNLAAPEPGKVSDIFNKSFKKKKAEGKFIRLKKALNLNFNDDEIINKNKNEIKNEIIDDEDKFKTLPNELSLNLLENKKVGVGYQKKIVSKCKNAMGNAKLNETTYSNFNQFDNDDEEEKKEDYKDKLFNRTFYKGFNFKTYNKKIVEKKDNSFMINDNKNENKKEKNQKIVKSIELLIEMLSLNGLKEVQSEVEKRINDIQKSKNKK